MGKRLLIYVLMAAHDILTSLLLLVFVPLSLFHKKTRVYSLSRMRTLKICQSISTGENNRVVFYCSSVGEFEQAIPLINMFESKGQKVVLFFHSKQGYDYCKKVSEIEAYLTPFDLCFNWILILSKIKPVHFIINRNEFWPGSLMGAFTCSNIYIINFVVKQKRDPIERFGLYLSKKVFQVDGHNSLHGKIITTGDTRHDRLAERHETNKKLIEELRILTKINTSQKLVVLGNAYSTDLKVLFRLKSHFRNFKFLIIPARSLFDAHQFPYITVVKSPALIDWNKNDVIMLDMTGILFELYGCADLAWIGGGFGNGVHNCIEADFFNIPLISGPSLNRQPDALQCYADNKLQIFNNADDLELVLKRIIQPTAKVNRTKIHSPTSYIYSLIHEDYNTGQKEFKSCA